MSSTSQTTIADICDFLLRPAQHEGTVEEKLAKALTWPPDVFCICAAILKHSGAYTWLPIASIHTLRKEGEDIGKEWRDSIDASAGKGSDPIKKVEDIWKKISPHKPSPIAECAGSPELLRNLYRLLVISDEACRGFGLPMYPWGCALNEADEVLDPKQFGSSLCKEIHPSRARVLPKTHTPPSGLTLRSLSHHLSYIEADEGRPLWYTVPGGPHDVNNINVLLVPWPHQIQNGQFRDVTERRGGTLATRHRLFDFEPEDTGGLLAEEICRLCQIARQHAGSIDVVIFPELALNTSDYSLIRQVLLSQSITLIAGLGGASNEGLRENRICLDIPIGVGHAVHLRQRKHHPWRLDHSQIQQYKMFCDLDPTAVYWEDLEIGDRHLCFTAIHPRLLTTVLICEDLARHEPVGELVRAVGPNLVIALLMDGPQILERWPARYATVLADDPGCSVLSLTSLGMSARTKDPERQKDQSRIVALWKDSAKSATQLELPEGAGALLLTLSMKETNEWTTDMRSYPAFNPILSGCHAIKDEGQDCGPSWFDRKKALPDIKFISPVEASALARLAHLAGRCRESLKGSKKWSVDWDNLSKGYSSALPKLGPEARRIAEQLVLRSGAVHEVPSIAFPKATGRESHLERTEEDFQKDKLADLGIPWEKASPAEPSSSDPDVIMTADAILHWRDRSVQFEPEWKRGE
jgi:hypothetical protein